MLKTFNLIGGYPGSGKTTYVKNILSHDDLLLDDCKCDDFTPSIVTKNNVFITNPNFVTEKYRNQYIKKIKHYYPDCDISLILFENDFNNCLFNALKREINKNGHSNKIELSLLRLQKNFSIPENITAIPVYKDVDYNTNDIKKWLEISQNYFNNHPDFKF